MPFHIFIVDIICKINKEKGVFMNTSCSEFLAVKSVIYMHLKPFLSIR